MKGRTLVAACLSQPQYMKKIFLSKENGKPIIENQYPKSFLTNFLSLLNGDKNLSKSNKLLTSAIVQSQTVNPNQDYLKICKLISGRDINSYSKGRRLVWEARQMNS